MNDTASATLLELYRTGTLTARYPEVKDLLADMSEAEIITAGQLLSKLEPDGVLAAHPDVPAVSVAITGHGTLTPIVPPLTAELARHGLLARIVVGDFDGYVTDLGDPRSELYQARPDLTLCILDPMTIFDEVPVPWRPEDVERAAVAKISLISGLANRFRELGGGTLVLNTVPLPHLFTAQLVSHRGRARLGSIWRQANDRLLRLAEDNPAVVVIDLEPLIGEGVPILDPRMSLYAKVHLSTELLTRYSREIGHLARHTAGRTRKLLALDLDETVWGGVLGEDGPEGIEVADGYRGQAFTAFQRVVRQLASQGVLLAAVSKNDAEAVAAVLRDHPDMTLRTSDFVRVTANWRPKPDNLTELAKVLNIGVDSFVFADDSPYERGSVRYALPQVAVVALGNEPVGHIGALLRDGWFDCRELTAEDHARPQLYREELERKDFLDGFTSLDDYLAELGVTVRLERAKATDTARISQLTLRTNQFNMTTRRMKPPDLTALLEDPDGFVLSVRSADRFGDNGLVGAVLAHRSGDVLAIDNFLLSCRVFSRGIEQACLAALLRHAKELGVTEVHAEHRRTAKNGPAAGFFPRHGFVVVSEEDGTTRYRHGLDDLPAHPIHIHLTGDIGGNRP